jgi:hypothetical protein
MNIQRRNFLESIRPELVISEWSRTTRPPGVGDIQDAVSFGRIKNIGRGSALSVVINATAERKNAPLAVMSTASIPILGPGEERPIAGMIIVFWKNHESTDRPRSLQLPIVIWCWDSRGNRYFTTYRIFISESMDRIVGGAENVAPGVASLTRRAAFTSVFWLRIEKRLPAFMRRRIQRQA